MAQYALVRTGLRDYILRHKANTALIDLHSPAMAVEPHSISPSVSSTPSPYITAPSSPKLLPSDVAPPPKSEIQLHDSARSSFVPFNWEDKPGKPKSVLDSGAGDVKDDDYEEIAFEFCVDRFESFSLPAEELFDDGKIKPLRPPPRLQVGAGSEVAESPATRRGRRKTLSWSSRRSHDFADPFEAAIETARKGQGRVCESKVSKTALFDGSRRFSRLRNLLPLRRFSSEGGGGRATLDSDSKAEIGFGSNGSSSSGSGSVHEPVNGNGCLLRCFMKRF